MEPSTRLCGSPPLGRVLQPVELGFRPVEHGQHILAFIVRVHVADGAARFAMSAMVEADDAVAGLDERLDVGDAGGGFTSETESHRLQHQRISFAAFQCRRLEHRERNLVTGAGLPGYKRYRRFRRETDPWPAKQGHYW